MIDSRLARNVRLPYILRHSYQRHAHCCPPRGGAKGDMRSVVGWRAGRSGTSCLSPADGSPSADRGHQHSGDVGREAAGTSPCTSTALARSDAWVPITCRATRRRGWCGQGDAGGVDRLDPAIACARCTGSGPTSRPGRRSGELCSMAISAPHTLGAAAEASVSPAAAISRPLQPRPAPTSAPRSRR